MPLSLDCPGQECWQALLDAALPPDELEHCERHLESCLSCQERLHQAEEGDDAVLRLARQGGDPTVAPADPPLERFLEQVRRTMSPEGSASWEPADLYFLHPSDEPGILGTLGEYEVQEVIGQGGMGVVLKAHDPALHRLVAIKVLSPALAGSATARQRFSREARAAAAVCHENVVAVHGVHEVDGLPYLVMQHVAGESLQARLDRRGPLEVEEVVRIGMQTALGLAAAHAQGLIHRDVKPANLLLEAPSPSTPLPQGERGEGRVKITDFGLARTADDVHLTQNGVLAGTPEYMAPEQARGEAVDHRADLFSLGGVLYALCTGIPPFRGPSVVAVLRQVSDDLPAAVRSANPDIPAWLETLIARLMAKDPAQRFQSAAEVATLLEGYLAHLRQPAVPPPPLPCPPANGHPPPSFRKRFWLGALVLLALVGLGGGLIGHGLSGGGPPAPAAEDTGLQPAPAEGEVDEGVWALTFSPDGQRLVSAGADHHLPGQLQVWDVAAGKPLFARRGFPGVPAAVHSPDGQVLATGHFGGEIKLRDPRTGEEQTTLSGHHIGVNSLAFSADGTLLASAGLDKAIKLWDVKALQERQEILGHTGMVFSVAFFRHGRAVVSGSDDRTARIWDLETSKERFVLRGHRSAVQAVAISPDDKLVATGSWDRTIKLWDAQTGRETASIQHKGALVQALVFSPDGATLASAGSNGTVYLWDVASQKLLKSTRQHDGIVRSLAFSPQGNLLVSGGEDKAIQFWDLAADRTVANLSAHAAEATTVVTSEAAPQSPPTKPWLAALAIVLGLLLALALLLWLFARRGGSNKTPAPPGGNGRPAQTAAEGRSISFSCPDCGKKLRAGTARAGKKVKCPQCGQAVAVPGGAAGDSIRTP